MATIKIRNDTARNKEGVSNIISPIAVLAFYGHPTEPSRLSHSASCPTTYEILNMDEKMAAHFPNFRTEGEILFSI